MICLVMEIVCLMTPLGYFNMDFCGCTTTLLIKLIC